MRKRRSLQLLILFFVSLALFYLYLLKEAPPLLLLDTLQTTEFSSDLKNVPPPEVDDGCEIGEKLYDDFCVYSFSEGQRDPKELGDVTLCTQGTHEFLHHVTVLCQRWGGPISVAVYAPAEDFENARTMVNHLRQCDFCIRHWVSWSFFFRKTNATTHSSGENSLADCGMLPKMQKRKRSEDTYPINVGRNLARNRTLTPYVFSIDIELYPSLGIPSKFGRMLLNTDLVGDNPQVWVIPVFEVGASYRVPTSKIQLKKMYASKHAISFHKFRCNICHRIPNLTEWFNDEVYLKSEVNETLETMEVFTTVKRSRKYNLQEWEPFFIGTKNDPEFDIRLSWEGKQNKMQMAFEMCMKNYDFHIISNAFLVHAPGINVYNASKEKFRVKHQYKNKKLISEIKKYLKKRYKTKYC